VGDGSAIKRFFRQNGFVLLISENDKYPPQKYSENDGVRVIGKVIKVADSFREHCNHNF
jgi:SOS-response transcriptional repressor LexA